MAAINVIAADSEAEALRLFTTPQQSFTNLVRGRPGRLPAPVDDIETVWTPVEKAHAMRMLARSVVGAPEQVRAGVAAFVEETGVDEVIVASAIFDHGARRHSVELLAEAVGLQTPGAPLASAIAVGA